MKLPRDAVRVGIRSAYSARGELDGTVALTRWVADPYDEGTHAAGPYNVVDGWRACDGYVVKRQQVRKLIRRLLAAVDQAEALEHGARIVRKGLR